MAVNIDQFKSIKALVVGDLMIDEYLWGSVERVSPEAPVPVVCIEKESHTLGGAGNVINNLKAMGARVCAIGTAGTGKAGQMIFEKLKELEISSDTIVSEPERPTTRKTRVIASNQQVVRIDKEIKRDINRDTLERLVGHIQNHIQDADLLILSDYDKGLITRELVHETVKLARQYGVLTLADPKSLNFEKYAGVNVMTPNMKEASLAANMDIKTDQDLEKAGQKLVELTKVDRLLITCGKDGMVLFENKKAISRIQSEARQVFDVSGAGDTVISLLGLGLSSGADFEQSARIANAAAGIVVGKVGTATPTIHELKQALSD